MLGGGYSGFRDPRLFQLTVVSVLLLCAALDGGLPALFLVPVGQSFLQAISPARRQRAPVS